MAAICGVWGSDHHLPHPGIHDCLPVLEPHGEISRWSGSLAGRPLHLAVASRNARATRTIGVVGDGKVVVLADSRLHRTGSLAHQLGLTTSTDDATLVAHAYLRWGDRFIDHLDGSFALAVADQLSGSLLLARDHRGSRPLTLHRRSDLIAFASNALTLTALPGVGHALDERKAAEVILLGYSSERTFVRGVLWVPPNTCERITPGPNGSWHHQRWRWWRSETIERRDLGSLRAHADELRAALEDAVRAELAITGRAGVSLSGGLDSAAVTAVAARQLDPQTLRTYTSVPPPGWVGAVRRGWIPDERFAIDALQRMHPNLQPNFFESTGLDLLAHHEATWELGAGPARNPTNMWWLHGIAQDAGADGVDVLLNGGVGNKAFSADAPFWLADHVRHGHPLEAHREARAWSRAHPGQRLPTLWRQALVAPFVPGRVRRWRHRDTPDAVQDWLLATAINPDQLSDLDPYEVLPNVARPWRWGWTRDHRQLFDTGAAQSEHRLAVEALWDVTSADPTGDRRLLEVAFAQPDRWRRHRGVSRAICRAAFADLLPPEIVDRTTRGSQLPDWFDRLSDQIERLRDELEEMRDHPTSRRIIDVPRLERTLRDWPDRYDSHDKSFIRDAQLALPRAILVSRYMRWFETRARRVAAGGPAVVLPPR